MNPTTDAASAPPENSIPSALEAVRARIAESERKYARVAGSVQLLAVGKTQGCDKLRSAYAAGQRHFAENYVQEALGKMREFVSKDIVWHYIGPIQSNKTKELAGHFDWVHTVDRAKIAQRLSEQRPAHKPPLNVLLQVNVSDEASKSGTSFAALPELARTVADLPNVLLRGLMAIPAPSDDFATQRQAFRRLAEARDQLIDLGYTNCQELSMGMSQDMEAAIAEGATMVRIGTDIFGRRN